jgi:hypothetical protein
MPYPALLTPANFSDATGGKIAADDPRVAPLIDGATRGIRRYCGWHVGTEYADTLKLDGPGSPLLQPRTLRIKEITSITERVYAGQDPVTLVEDVDFEWSENGEIRRLGGAWWTDRYRSIDVEMTHGFEDVDDLVQIIQQVVGNAISSPLGATREQAGQLSVQWATTAPGVSGGLSLLQRDMAILDSYRIVGA